jgi:hypothetical protein
MTKDDQAELVTRLAHEQAELEARIDAEARATAHALIQGYMGPDYRVTSMSDFYCALVQALKAAREQGQMD